jgi:hypothetical protein
MAKAAETHTIESLPTQGFDNPTSTTRRSFLAAAAAGGIAAAASPAVPAEASVNSGPSPELVELGDKLLKAHEAFIEADNKLFDAFEFMREWDRANSEPCALDADGDVGQRHRDWMEARKAALKSCDKLALHRQRDAAIQEHRDFVNEVVDFQAKTIHDLILKAELAIEADTDACHIASSVAEDLLEMAAAKVIA